MQAQSIADHSPLFLQTAAAGKYKTTYSGRDFIPVFMRGHGGFHQAVLVTENPDQARRYHCSYFQEQLHPRRQ
jgi:hypothetical protein